MSYLARDPMRSIGIDSQANALGCRRDVVKHSGGLSEAAA